jgi:hypothetical protein
MEKNNIFKIRKIKIKYEAYKKYKT